MTDTELDALEAASWLVWSHEHNAFWRPHRCGYTPLIEDAGRYTKAEAETICADANPRAWSEDRPDGPPPEICFPAPEALAAAPSLIADARRVQELEALIEQAASILENCTVTSGVCCCGDDMERHPEPISCGHSPVDQGAYCAQNWLDDARPTRESKP